METKELYEMEDQELIEDGIADLKQAMDELEHNYKKGQEQ